MSRHLSTRNVVPRVSRSRSSAKPCSALSSVLWHLTLRPGLRGQVFTAKVDGPLHRLLYSHAHFRVMGSFCLVLIRPSVSDTSEKKTRWNSRGGTATDQRRTSAPSKLLGDPNSHDGHGEAHND